MVKRTIPIPFASDNDVVAVDRLKNLMEHYPEEDDDLRFAYALFTYSNAQQLLSDGDTISEVKVQGYRFTDLGFVDIQRLRSKCDTLQGFASSILDTSLEENDRLGTAQYKRWAEAYKAKVTEGWGAYQHQPVPSRGNDRFRINYGLDFVGPQSASEKVYIQHQHICKLWDYYKTVKMEHVYDYIAGGNGRAIATVRDVEAPTDIVVPDIDKEAIQKAAAEIPALEYKEISGFGVDVETEAGRAMTQLASYFLYNATRAAHTHECIEAAQDEIANANLDVIIRDDPNGWWERTTSRVRLVQPKDMPMMRLVEQFSSLPDLAEMDSEAYATDLDIVDQAIKVCGGYHTLLTEHRDALKEQKERLLTSDRDDLPTEIATAGIPEVIEQRINSLSVTAQHMVAQASNFGSIGQVVSANRSRLGRIAGMPATLQMPAMDAIRKFNLYQMRRMQLLGKTVDDTIKRQLNINEDILPSAIEDASPDATKKALSSMFDAIGKDLISFQQGLEGDSDKQKKIAQEIKDKAIEMALESDDPEFNPVL